MTPAQLIDTAEQQGLSQTTSPADLRGACHILSASLRRMQECLRWASGQRIGPGGIAHAELSTILSSAGRGEDWKAMRDTYLTRKRR